MRDFLSDSGNTHVRSSEQCGDYSKGIIYFNFQWNGFQMFLLQEMVRI